MATLKKADHTAMSGPGKELPRQTPERTPADVLLDISEDSFLKEMEPFEYHCYPGWEEAARGWARVAPMSCIFLTQKRSRQPKHQKGDNPTPLPADPTISNADSPASIEERHCKTRVGPHDSLKKSLNQHTGPRSNTAVAALQSDASVWPVLNEVQKHTSHLLLEGKVEEEAAPIETPLQIRAIKPQKCSSRPNNALVPIKQFTFLPPIKSTHPQTVNRQLCSGKTAPEGEIMEEDCFMFDKKSRMRGARVDPVANPELPTYSAGLTSENRTCPHNPHLFSVVTVSAPKSYQVPVSSKRDTVHRNSYSPSSLGLTRGLHSGTAAGAQARTHPSRTACAVKLYEDCEINV